MYDTLYIIECRLYADFEIACIIRLHFYIVKV